ncbi:MAG TPA: hypothetical protein VFZ22_09125, partial [Pyrinomonadaceae bacterium]|nr:hypothetical protein [Pyrinomonadaceae bacterium]
MSDFLTNLVVRSFSPAPSFQPMVAPAASTYVEPYETVTETPVTATAKPPVPIADERVVNTPVVPAESIGHHELPPVAPEKFEPVKHEFQEQSVVPAASLETTDPRPETPPVVESPVQPATRQLMRKAVRATPQPKPAAPRLRTTTRRASATHKSEPPIVEQVVEHVTEHLTQQVVERPAVTIENHHEITKIQN